MPTKETYSRHYEENTVVNSGAESVFAYADDFANFSSHMNKSSWMMGGGKMETVVDEGKGQRVGSHIKMKGTVFGIGLFLDEVVTIYEPPYHMEWQTLGEINLVVIDHYRLGFQIEQDYSNSKFKVYIDYNLPKSRKTHMPGVLFGGMYAKWCVQQMIRGVKTHFATPK